MIEIAIGLIRLQDWFGGDFSKVVELVRIADDRGVDLVTLTDHLAFTASVAAYPHGAFDFPLATPFFEPLIALSAIGAVTQRIRLSTNVLIGPLRPALLLAKQLATLDVNSGGRVEIALGAGWQKEEFDACGVPFRGRFGLLMEQAEAMRTLWREAPASFEGAHVAFEHLYSLPFPVQTEGIPILFGLSASERNLERLAQHADGWAPVDHDPDVLATQLGKLRQLWRQRGRDPAKLKVRVMPEGTTSRAMRTIAERGRLDLGATAERMSRLIEAGATQFEFHPAVWVSGPEEFPRFMDQLVALKAKLSGVRATALAAISEGKA